MSNELLAAAWLRADSYELLAMSDLHESDSKLTARRPMLTKHFSHLVEEAAFILIRLGLEIG
jgi:hypothetical protein